MAASRPAWLADLSRSFKRHRGGRPGWFLELHRDRLRIRSDEFPARPGATGKRQAITLDTPPGPTSAAYALAEAIAIFDGVMAKTWTWPDADAIPAADDVERLRPPAISRLIGRLHDEIVGEVVANRTWERNYLPYFDRLLAQARVAPATDEESLLREVLLQWPAGSRSRQMAHDRIRALWKVAGWSWPEPIAALRGNGRAAADPRGVRAFTDPEIAELRARILESRLAPSVVTAWDCLTVFGIRPVELQGLEVRQEGGVPLATVTRGKTNSHGTTGYREVVAVPPAGWPVDCFGLVERLQEHGIAPHLTDRRNVGDRMAHQLKRLQMNRQIEIALHGELTPYSLRHAYALRLGIDLPLSIREASEMMGHSPAVHVSTYGRRLDAPKLKAKVQQLVQQKVLETSA